mmetsp:Transcript_8639/g.13384  ORF Transcript_8639/g.13384 Transcript_8639/m.13384 type:complete len:151 (-) Transcript_8639:1379-1831(-)
MVRIPNSNISIEAVNEFTDQRVAVKVIHKTHPETNLNALRHEIKILKNTFLHPHIVKYFDYLDSSNSVYIVMEYVKGGELFSLVSSQGKLSASHARRLFIQLLSGLQYAHNHGLAHRDLKPENILLDDEGNLKICDFGLCASMQDGLALK